MIENLLKLCRRFRVSALGHQRLAAHVGGVETTEIEIGKVEPVWRQLIVPSDVEALHALLVFTPPQVGERAKDRRVGKPHKRIFRESLFQIAGSLFRSS